MTYLLAIKSEEGTEIYTFKTEWDREDFVYEIENKFKSLGIDYAYGEVL